MQSCRLHKHTTRKLSNKFHERICRMSYRVETWFACTEADFQDMPRVCGICAKPVRGTFPWKRVRNMRGGITKCADPLQPEKITDLFSRVLSSCLPPFDGHPSSSSFLGTFSPFSPFKRVLCSVEQRAQCRAWRGAAPGEGNSFPKSAWKFQN